MVVLYVVVCCIIHKTTTNATGEAPAGSRRPSRLSSACRCRAGGGSGSVATSAAAPSGKAPDRRIERVGPSLEWLQAAKNGQVGQDQGGFMRSGTRIWPPRPVNRAFAGSDSSIVFTFAGRHPAHIEAAAAGQRLASGSYKLFGQKTDRTERATSDLSGCSRGQGWPRLRKRGGGPLARPFKPF